MARKQSKSRLKQKILSTFFKKKSKGKSVRAEILETIIKVAHGIKRLTKPAKLPRLVAVLLLLTMFLGAALLPPSFAYMSATTPTVQTLPDAQRLVEQGRNSYEAERFAEAVTIWQQAMTEFKASRNELKQAMTLSNLSLAYQQLGQWTEAESTIAQSLNLLKTSPKINAKERSQVLAQALDIQGRLQLALAKAEAALSTWKQAANMYDQIDDQNAAIRNRINQAQALQALGLYRQAQKTLTESTQLLQNQPNSPLKVTGLRSLSNVLRVTGNLDQSRRILQQSLEIAKTLPNSQVLGDVLLSLGNIARAQQDTQAAIKFYQQAANTPTSPITRVHAQINQLSLLLETNQLDAYRAFSSQVQAQIGDLPLNRMAVYARINFAQSLIQFRQKTTTDTPSWLEIAQSLSKAVEQAKTLQDQRTESYALGVLGSLYEKNQQWQNAQDLTQDALLIAQRIGASDIAYQWQWQLGRLLKTQQDNKGAIASYTESVNSLQSLRSDLTAINPEIQYDFRDQVEPVYRQLVDLLLLPQAGSQPSQPELVQARNAIESLQLAELDNFFRVACIEGRPILVDEVINQDDPTAAAFYPIISADQLAVILKLPNQPLRYYKTSVPQSQVEGLLEDLRQNLIKPQTLLETRSLSQQLYDWLIRPAEADLAKSQIKTLVFVLDGSLRNIPIAALYDGQQYLIQKYAVALTPGLQLLTPKPFEGVQLKALTAGLSEARQGFPALTNVRLELDQIKSEVNSQILLNQGFTSTALQKEINEVPFPIVHLATHGQFSSQADKTFILAWDKPVNVNQLDSLLRIRDTTDPNAIELLVLSACQTAAGDKRAALGLAGVAVRAGARSTLASLWNLDDESTALLMSQFYRELAENPPTKVEALRRAQVALLKNPRYQHPMFWSPYVLIGNWL